MLANRWPTCSHVVFLLCLGVLLELVVLMPAVSCDFLPLSLHPRGSHVTVLHHDNEGEKNAGGGNLQGGSSPGRYHFLFTSFVSLSFFCCILSLLLFPSHLLPFFSHTPFFHPFTLSFYHTYQLSHGFNTIAYSRVLIPRLPRLL